VQAGGHNCDQNVKQAELKKKKKNIPGDARGKGGGLFKGCLVKQLLREAERRWITGAQGEESCERDVRHWAGRVRVIKSGSTKWGDFLRNEDGRD